jgi:hypothetical protein
VPRRQVVLLVPVLQEAGPFDLLPLHGVAVGLPEAVPAAAAAEVQVDPEIAATDKHFTNLVLVQPGPCRSSTGLFCV